MSGTVVTAIVAAALLHATWNALLKGRSGDAHVTSTGLSLCWAVLSWPLVLATGPLPREAWGPLLGSIAVHVVYFSMLTAAYRTGELSLVYPIARGVPPVLIAFGAALQGEALSAVGTLGVALVALGVAAIGPGAPAGRRATLLALGCAGCTAVYTLFDAAGVRASDPASYGVRLFAWQGTCFAGGALLLGGRSLARAVWARRRVSLATGVMSAGGYAAALWAMAHAPVAAVAALRETAVLFAAVIGAVALGERFGPRRWVAAALIAVGAVCVRAG